MEKWNFNAAEVASFLDTPDLEIEELISSYLFRSADLDSFDCLKNNVDKPS